MRFLMTVLGTVLLILSIPIGALTPFIPIGLPMAIVGLLLVGRNSRLGKGLIVRTARRHPRTRQLYLARLRPALLR